MRIGSRQIQYDVSVITFDATRIAAFAGAGSSAPPCSQRARRVPRLVLLHLLDHRAALFVLRRQPREMSFEVRHDLALRLGEKTQVPAVPSRPAAAPIANDPA